MGFRFRRTIRIAPGVRINLSKSGVSTSIGVRGAQVTVGRKTRATVGLPGTGLSYTQELGDATGERPASGAALLLVFLIILLSAILYANL